MKATINSYRLRFYEEEEELLNLKTTCIAIPQVNNCIKINENYFIVKEITPKFITNIKDKYPYIEYIIKVEKSRRNDND